MRYYPVYLDLRGRLVTVVGGGEVAEEKVVGLLEAGARVRVVAAELTDEVARHVATGTVEHIARDYQNGDQEGAFLVFSERISPEVDQAVWDEAESLGIPCNVQDDTPHCSFIAASIVRQGDLTITISTAGKAPALAVRMRQELEKKIGPHYARFLDLAGTLRAPLVEKIPEFAPRRDLWYQLVDSDVLELLRAGDEEQACERMTEIMGVAPDASARHPSTGRPQPIFHGGPHPSSQMEVAHA